LDITAHPESELLAGKQVHLAIPLRLILLGLEERGPAETACTYDIHPHGARLLSARAVSLGDLVMLERGRNKAVCQVIWTANPDSALRGQFAVRCIEEGRTPWDDELRQLEEQFQPLILDELKLTGARGTGRIESNRRRCPRFYVDGQAEVIDGVQRVDGVLQQLSEFGARITATDVLHPGADFRLLLNVFDVSVALKAQVRYLVNDLAMGVEFQEIRRGDRPLLSYVISRLRIGKMEVSAPAEATHQTAVTVVQ